MASILLSISLELLILHVGVQGQNARGRYDEQSQGNRTSESHEFATPRHSGNLRGVLVHCDHELVKLDTGLRPKRRLRWRGVSSILLSPNI